MQIKLKSLKEILSLSADERAADLVPSRVATAKAKATLLIAETDEKIANLEGRLRESTSAKDIDFNRVADMIDEMELLGLRKQRFADISDQLFPVEPATPVVESGPV